jgi:hypothetical protein
MTLARYSLRPLITGGLLTASVLAGCSDERTKGAQGSACDAGCAGKSAAATDSGFTGTSGGQSGSGSHIGGGGGGSSGGGRSGGGGASTGGGVSTGGGTSDGGPATTGPVVKGPPGCGLAAAAFCDDFELGPHAKRGRAGDLDPTRWSAGRFPGQDFSAPGEACPVQLGPIPPCRASLQKSEVYPDEDTLICDRTGTKSAQLMTLVAEQNYGVASYRIRQPFDFAGRTGKIVFDVDAVTEGGLASWVSLDLTEDPITANNYAADPKLGNERGPVPRSGLTISFNAGGCDSEHDAPGQGAWNSVGYILSYDRYQQKIISTDHTDCFRTAWGSLNHVEVSVSKNHVDITVSDASTDGGATFPNLRKLIGVDVDLPFTRGYVHITGHNHAVQKYCHPGSGFCAGGEEIAPSYHWDNVGFDGPVISSFREYEIPDSLTPTTTRGMPAVNTGYIVGDVDPARAGLSTCCPDTKLDALRFVGVDISDAVSARLAFNSFYLLSQVTVPVTQVDLRYRLNGGQWHDRYISDDEAASQDPSKAVPNYWLDTGNFAQVVEVPIGELVAGDNTVEFATVNSPGGYPTVVANIDLILETAR